MGVTYHMQELPLCTRSMSKMDLKLYNSSSNEVSLYIYVMSAGPTSRVADTHVRVRNSRGKSHRRAMIKVHTSTLQSMHDTWNRRMAAWPLAASLSLMRMSIIHF